MLGQSYALSASRASSALSALCALRSAPSALRSALCALRSALCALRSALRRESDEADEGAPRAQRSRRGWWTCPGLPPAYGRNEKFCIVSYTWPRLIPVPKTDAQLDADIKRFLASPKMGTLHGNATGQIFSWRSTARLECRRWMSSAQAFRYIENEFVIREGRVRHGAVGQTRANSH